MSKSTIVLSLSLVFSSSARAQVNIDGLPSDLDGFWGTVGSTGLDSGNRTVGTVIRADSNGYAILRGFFLNQGTLSYLPLTTGTPYTLRYNRSNGISNNSQRIAGEASFFSAPTAGLWQSPTGNANVNWTPVPGELFSSSSFNYAWSSSINSSALRTFSAQVYQSSTGYRTAAGTVRGLGTTAQFEEIGFLGTVRPRGTVANAVNEQGYIVGISGGAPSSYRPFACKYSASALPGQIAARCPMVDLGSYAGLTATHVSDVSDKVCNKAIAAGWASNSGDSTFRNTPTVTAMGRPLFWILTENGANLNKQGPFALPMPPLPSFMGSGNALAAFATGVSPDYEEIVGFACQQDPQLSACFPGGDNPPYAVRWRLRNRSNPALGYTVREFACPERANCDFLSGAVNYFLHNARDVNNLGTVVGLAQNVMDYGMYAVRVRNTTVRPAVTCPVVATCLATTMTTLSNAYASVFPRAENSLTALKLTADVTTTACVRHFAIAYSAAIESYARLTRTSASRLSTSAKIVPQLPKEIDRDLLKQIIDAAAGELRVQVNPQELERILSSHKTVSTEAVAEILVAQPYRCCPISVPTCLAKTNATLSETYTSVFPRAVDSLSALKLAADVVTSACVRSFALAYYTTIDTYAGLTNTPASRFSTSGRVIPQLPKDIKKGLLKKTIYAAAVQLRVEVNPEELEKLLDPSTNVSTDAVANLLVAKPYRCCSL